jgi:hypothetical protein
MLRKAAFTQLHHAATQVQLQLQFTQRTGDVDQRQQKIEQHGVRRVQQACLFFQELLELVLDALGTVFAGRRHTGKQIQSHKQQATIRD